MVKFLITTKEGQVNFNFPTSIEELTSDYLKCVTKEIKVADNYSLVALCHREKLSAFVLAGKQKKNELATAVVPVFVKKGNITINSINQTAINTFMDQINLGERLIISGTALSMGIHVNAPMNILTINNFMKHIESDGFAYQNATKITEPVYFVEFKIIPNNDIIGVYKPELRENFDNVFGPIKVGSIDTTAGV